MTMVAGCLFSDGAVILADSRITWTSSAQDIYSDIAQKILTLGPNLAFAFAGRIDLANDILMEMRRQIKNSPRIANPLKLPIELSRVSRYYYQRYSKKYTNEELQVFIILTGIISGKIFLWAFNPPNFSTQFITSGYVIVGSGSIVEPRLRKAYVKLIRSTGSLKNKADILIAELESELKQHGIHSVGGLFQVILISLKGIVPLNYGFLDLKPEAPGFSKEITMSKGVWTQKDLSQKKEIKLLEPKQILELSPIEGRFHDFKPPELEEKKLRWYLNYLITCLNVERNVKKIRFDGVLSQIGSFIFPLELPFCASIGFWGSSGHHTLKISLDNNKKQTEIHRQKINIQYPYELNEVDVPMSLKIEKPGPAFLNFHIDDFLLSRKALYFGHIENIQSAKTEDIIAQRDKIRNNLVKKHQACTDPALQNVICFPEYFIVCQDCSTINDGYEFVGEIRAVYWKKYPLLLKTHIATSIRLPKGKHKIEVYLVNAQTSERSTIATIKIDGKYECSVTRIHGDFIVKIPEPGIYFLNLNVDGQFISSELLPAETDKPKYSYSLPEESIKRVSEGELLILLRRSKSAKEN